MGKKPDEIQREIEEHRDRISGRLTSLQGRVQDDIQSVKSLMDEGASGIAGRTSESLNLRSQLEEHPLTAVAGGLGLGVLLGVTSDGLLKAGGGRPNMNSNGYNNGAAVGNSDSSFLASALGSLTAVAGEVLKDEVRQFVRGIENQSQAISQPRPARPAA